VYGVVTLLPGDSLRVSPHYDACDIAVVLLLFLLTLLFCRRDDNACLTLATTLLVESVDGAVTGCRRGERVCRHRGNAWWTVVMVVPVWTLRRWPLTTPGRAIVYDRTLLIVGCTFTTCAGLLAGSGMAALLPRYYPTPHRVTMLMVMMMMMKW
jgi:hypothetical protein